MMTVHEVSKLTGLSVRALHHYDAIGLLKPTAVTEAGYRLYGMEELDRLQTILLFRELGTPLKEIKTILDAPGFDRAEALKYQIGLLKIKREHITGLISLAESILEKGTDMDFTAFDDSKQKAYAEEAKRRWGDSSAWREYEEKGPSSSAAEGLMELFARFGKLKDLPPEGPEAQAAVEKLRAFISENYYNCTCEILHGLGQMYVSDPRFRENIDRAGGGGTAEFAARAIEAYRR